VKSVMNLSYLKHGEFPDKLSFILARRTELNEYSIHNVFKTAPEGNSLLLRVLCSISTCLFVHLEIHSVACCVWV
jgi:hypothetical protein